MSNDSKRNILESFISIFSLPSVTIQHERSIDCAGVCYGDSEYDVCGECQGTTIDPLSCPDAGVN